MNPVKPTYSIARRNVSAGNPVWYGCIHADGKIRYVSLKTASKTEAKAWLEERYRNPVAEPGGDAAVSVPMDIAVRKWLVSVEVAKGPGRTLMAYQSRVKRFVEFLKASKKTSFDRITQPTVIDFVNTLSGYSGKSAGEIIKVAHLFWEFWGSLTDYYGRDPFQRIKRPKVVKKAKAFWTVEQCEQIIAQAPDERYAFLWSLMAWAGLRYEEAVSLRWEDIKDGKITIVGKMNRLASVPLSDRLERFLKPGSTGKIFGDGMSKYNDSNLAVLRRAFRASGLISVGEINHHRFRHSFASNLIRAGVNVKVVQQLMRHESITVTLNTYGHLLDSDMTDALRKLDGASSPKKTFSVEDLNLVRNLYDGNNVEELCSILGTDRVEVRELVAIVCRKVPVVA